MHKKRISQKYKDLFQMAIIIAVLLSYAYHENNRKKQLASSHPQEIVLPIPNTPVVSHK